MPSNSTTFLKFILSLRVMSGSANTQNTLVVLKYPVTTRLVSQFTSTAGQQCVPIQSQASASLVQATCTGSTYQAAVALRTTKPATADNPITAAAVAAITQVQIYPNPATNTAILNFVGTAVGRASAYLTDIFGNRVLTIMQNENVMIGEQRKSFDTSSLRSGLYQCVVETPDGKRRSSQLSIVW